MNTSTSALINRSSVRSLCSAGKREADERNRLTLPPQLSLKNLERITKVWSLGGEASALGMWEKDEWKDVCSAGAAGRARA